MKNKILILVESLKVGGGSERFAATLGSKLYDKGYDIHYLTLMDEKPHYPFKGTYHTLDEGDIYGNLLKRTWDLFRYSPKITSLCKRLGIETIISVSEVANFHAVLSRWFYGNKVIIIASQHINPEIFLESSIKRFLIKFFYPQADKVVCVSKETERILNLKYEVKNTLTIYNMMNIQENINLSHEDVPDKFMKLFEDKNSFRFINVGRLTRQKGQWFLIRSFKRVVEKHPDSRLFILGNGVLRRELEDLINDLQLNENVFLLGEQKKIFSFLKNSNCFVLSSLWEGLPLVLIEALSLDLPVISTDCKTGPREILCKNKVTNGLLQYPCFCEYGILSKPFHDKMVFSNLDINPLDKAEEMLSDLINKIIEDEDLKKKYSAVKEISDKFDEEKITKEWIKLINELTV